MTFEYQWQRCDDNGQNCVDIAGRDRRQPTTLTAADQGHTGRGWSSPATNAAGTDTATSEPSTSARAAGQPSPRRSRRRGGGALTPDPGLDRHRAVTKAYQWQRCDFFGDNCVDIAGATDDTYTLTEEDTG